MNEGTAAENRAWMKPRWTSATAEKQHDNFAIPLPTRTLKLKWGCSSGEASNEHDLSKSREKLHGLARAGRLPSNTPSRRCSGQKAVPGCRHLAGFSPIMYVLVNARGATGFDDHGASTL